MISREFEKLLLGIKFWRKDIFLLASIEKTYKRHKEKRVFRSLCRLYSIVSLFVISNVYKDFNGMNKKAYISMQAISAVRTSLSNINMTRFLKNL